MPPSPPVSKSKDTAVRRAAKVVMFDRLPDGSLWAELVPYIAKPWSRNAAVHDLCWHRHQGLITWGGDLTPSQDAELAARWGWSSVGALGWL
jgi:hypothetical protein